MAEKRDTLSPRLVRRMRQLGIQSLSDAELLGVVQKIRSGAPYVEGISLETPQEKTAPLLQENGRLYLQAHRAYEEQIHAHLQRLQRAPLRPLFDPHLMEAELSRIDREGRLRPSQKRALQRAFQEPLFAFYGGPGSGKTYTAALFVELLARSLKEEETCHLYLTAPTGKAAVHLEKTLASRLESFPQISWQCMTLHRLLGVYPGQKRSFETPKLDADLILVDEASMMDIPLMAKLLASLFDGTRLLWIGDPHQLPPVENRSLFPQLAPRLGEKLEGCIRTDQLELVELAQAVLEGKREELALRLKRPSEAVRPFEASFDTALPAALLRWLQPYSGKEKPDPETSLSRSQELRILNPLRKGPFGTTVLNQALFRLLYDRAQEGEWMAIPIMVLTNDPYQRAFNGMGGIRLLQKGTKREEIYLQGRKGPFSGTLSYETAFCLSVHKSQGSEFSEVLALFPQGSERFGRELLYTAMTRAKKRFLWLGDLLTFFSF